MNGVEVDNSRVSWESYPFPIFSFMKNTLLRRAAAGVGVSLTMAIGSFGLLTATPVSATVTCNDALLNMVSALGDMDASEAEILTADDDLNNVVDEMEGADDIEDDLLTAVFAEEIYSQEWDAAWENFIENTMAIGGFISTSTEIFADIDSAIANLVSPMAALDTAGEDLANCTL
jgi:hypothetical protein